MYKAITILLAVIGLAACQPGTKPAAETSTEYLDKADFDTVVDGKPISLYTLANDSGITVCLTNYGARIVALYTPDREGTPADIVLGFDNIKEYLADPMYLGCIVGRYANRIKDAKFTLDGEEYTLFKNDGDNTLHGGESGLNKKIWTATQDGNKVTFSYLSPDGEEGYPGNLSITKSFSLNDQNELEIVYTAETDKPTVINLSNHSYYNLKGEGDSTINDHWFMINADAYTPVDDEWIPTGEIAPVEGTPFDFRAGKQIGTDLEVENEQLANGKGYDHNWALNKPVADSMSLAAKLWEESTGRMIEIYTTEPGFQFYGGNFMDGSVTGKSGKPYQYRGALIFETQHFPDSPNHADFPSTVLRPGEQYRHIAVYKFGIKE